MRSNSNENIFNCKHFLCVCVYILSWCISKQHRCFHLICQCVEFFNIFHVPCSCRAALELTSCFYVGLAWKQISWANGELVYRPIKDDMFPLIKKKEKNHLERVHHSQTSHRHKIEFLSLVICDYRSRPSMDMTARLKAKSFLSYFFPLGLKNKIEKKKLWCMWLNLYWIESFIQATRYNPLCYINSCEKHPDSFTTLWWKNSKECTFCSQSMVRWWKKKPYCFI